MKVGLKDVNQYLLALLSCYFEWEAIAWNEVYIVVKDSTKIDKVVCVNRWDGIYNFLLKFGELVFMY